MWFGESTSCAYTDIQLQITAHSALTYLYFYCYAVHIGPPIEGRVTTTVTSASDTLSLRAFFYGLLGLLPFLPRLYRYTTPVLPHYLPLCRPSFSFQSSCAKYCSLGDQYSRLWGVFVCERVVLVGISVFCASFSPFRDLLSKTCTGYTENINNRLGSKSA